MNLNIASFRIMNMNIVIMYIAPFVAINFERYSIEQIPKLIMK